MRGSGIKTTSYIAGLLGLALATALVVYAGVGDLAEAFLAAGWGVALIVPFHMVPLFLSVLAWRAVLPGAAGASLGPLTLTRWIRESVNNLLPVAQVGGELVGARLLVLRGVKADAAGASVAVDFTLGLFAQVVFTLAGLGLLAAVNGEPEARALVYGLLAGLGLLLAGLLGFVLVQRRGLFALMARAADRLTRGWGWRSLAGGAARADRAVRALYGDRRAVLACGLWRLAAWLAGTGEIWILMYFLGRPVSLPEAMILESLGQAARSAGFLVPGAIGVQEGGYLVLGAVLGYEAPHALMLSLAKRARELILGAPGLLAWQAIEGRRLLKQRRPPADRP